VTPVAERAAPTWGLWGRQIAAVLRMELRKILWGKRAASTYLLALLPVLIMGLRALAILRGWTHETAGGGALWFATIYQNFTLRFVIFLGCAWVFTNLFRGEILDRSLHYYFLSPIRRDVLVVAKFVSGAAGSALVFSITTVVSFLLAYAPQGTSVAQEQLLARGGAGDLAAYVGVTVLGCIGYGAVFLLTSLFFRNPMIPALAILGLESINFLLPPLLKKISVIYYLVSLCPVRISEGPIALVAEPASAWVAVPGLLALATAVLWLASRRMRSAEISYASD
jgi:ABC-type transport system involved in multi-copper enzyme maturation permease subunit